MTSRKKYKILLSRAMLSKTEKTTNKNRDQQEKVQDFIFKGNALKNRKKTINRDSQQIIQDFIVEGNAFKNNKKTHRKKYRTLSTAMLSKTEKKLQRQELTGQNIGFCCQGQCFQKQQKQGLTGKNIGFYCQGRYFQKQKKNNKIKDSQEKIQE